MGACYEALAALTLEAILAAPGAPALSLAQRLRPSGLSTEADLLLLDGEGTPRVVFLVSHCTSPKNSEMKGWRNLFELWELKCLLASPPRVISLLFESRLKASQLELQRCAFDALFVADVLPGWEHISAALRAIAPTLTGPQSARRQQLASALRRRRSLTGPLATLRAQLAALLWPSPPRLSDPPGRLAGLWGLERARLAARSEAQCTQSLHSPHSPEGSAAPPLQLRRALAKLLLFEELPLARRLYEGTLAPGTELPAHLYRCGLARRSLAGPRGADDELRHVLERLDRGALERPGVLAEHLAEVAQGALRESISLLRGEPPWGAALAYLTEALEGLCAAAPLERALVAIHRDPQAPPPLCAERVSVGPFPRCHWLFELILALLKGASGAQSRFGYSQLTGAGAGAAVAALTARHQGRRRALSRAPLRRLAVSLAAALRALGSEGRRAALAALPEALHRHHLSNRLLTHRAFDPLRALLRDAYPDAVPARVRSCLADAAGLPRGAGALQLLRDGQRLIHCQSVSDAGRVHKRKELSARALALRYRWTGEGFEEIPGQSLILRLDGSWRVDDLVALRRAGWDQVERLP